MEQREFHPEVLSRRGEWISWGAALLGAAAWIFLLLTGNPVSVFLVIFEILMLLASIVISLGNYMDRHMVIRLGPEGIEYENGLRRAYLKWRDIQRVEVYPAGWSSRVRVLGETGRFAFRTLGEVHLRGETKDRIGFEKGWLILERILELSDLQEIKPADAPAGVRYYARK